MAGTKTESLVIAATDPQTRPWTVLESLRGKAKFSAASGIWRMPAVYEIEVRQWQATEKIEALAAIEHEYDDFFSIRNGVSGRRFTLYLPGGREIGFRYGQQGKAQILNLNQQPSSNGLWWRDISINE